MFHIYIIHAKQPNAEGHYNQVHPLIGFAPLSLLCHCCIVHQLGLHSVAVLNSQEFRSSSPASAYEGREPKPVPSSGALTCSGGGRGGVFACACAARDERAASVRGQRGQYIEREPAYTYTGVHRRQSCATRTSHLTPHTICWIANFFFLSINKKTNLSYRSPVRAIHQRAQAPTPDRL